MTTATCTRTDIASSGPQSSSSEAADARALVARATQGDSDAWTEIVRRYEFILHGTARRFGLTPEEHDDAVQRIWQRTIEHLHEVRDGAALPGWLATCMRRECLAALRARARETPIADMPDHMTKADEPDVVDGLIARYEARALRRAIGDLPIHQRMLIHALLETPVPSYAEISRQLNMPIGSIGPIRGRALRRLASTLSELRA